MLVSTRRKPVAYHIVIYHGHQIENGAHSLVDVLKIHERFSGPAFDTISTSRRRRWVSICQFEDATCVILHVSRFHLCH